MGFDGRMQLTTLEGQEQMVSQGPTAAIVPIKQLGTNGGGYFGVNSSHPLENPTYLTNMVECWSILIIPMAMVLALGFYTNRRKLGYSIFGVMLFAYLAGVFINVGQRWEVIRVSAKWELPRIMVRWKERGTAWSRSHSPMECHHNGYFQWFGQWDARFDYAAQWNGRDAEYADQYLVWRCWCRMAELLYLYYHGRFYQRTDGGAYAGISR